MEDVYLMSKGSPCEVIIHPSEFMPTELVECSFSVARMNLSNSHMTNVKSCFAKGLLMT